MATGSQGSSSKKLKQTQDILVQDHMVPVSTADLELMNDVPLNSLKSFGPASQNSDDLDGFSSDLSCYGDDLSYSDDDLPYDNETLSLQAQFDAVDLPPGVEASIPWLEQPAKSQNQAGMSSATVPSQLSSSSEKEKDKVEVWSQQPANSQKPAGTSSSTVPSRFSSCSEKEKKEEVGQKPSKSPKKPAATSSSTLPSQSSSSSSENGEKGEDEVLKRFRIFKQFDIVQDYSDHHFTHGGSKSKQAPQNWTKTIHQEWKILEKDMPDTIFVRAYEERMDLLRAVIVGAGGTPYHDGLFFFDVFFPSDYPNVPPQVFYYSGGLRLNPNLYNCGKVCLSLLNTWHGNKNEQWTPGKSTVLQVLLSIQALVLNAKPFFNEPGYESMAGGKEGERRARDYNEDTFILSCKTMLYTLRRPPKHFEDFVAGHFRDRAHAILVACKAYMSGAEVGCLVGGLQDAEKGDESSSRKLKEEVAKMLPRLVQAFTKNGAKDCEQFLPP